MGDNTYPTDELSHPEYVNDDFRMFTFKVGETGFHWQCYPRLMSSAGHLVMVSSSASRACFVLADDDMALY